jgi:hypothetical protein
MSTEPERSTVHNKYHVVSVEKTDTPDGMPDGNWHHYIIGRGKSMIEGFKPGSLRDVTDHVETLVEGLNERAVRGSSTYVAHKKKS